MKRAVVVVSLSVAVLAAGTFWAARLTAQDPSAKRKVWATIITEREGLDFNGQIDLHQALFDKNDERHEGFVVVENAFSWTKANTGDKVETVIVFGEKDKDFNGAVKFVKKSRIVAVVPLKDADVEIIERALSSKR